MTRPARIRMDQLVWEYVLGHDSQMTKHVNEKDELQAKIEKLVKDNPTARERILVTTDLDLIDLLRDWCAEMIGQASKNIKSGALSTAAGRTMDIIDHWESRTNGR